MDDRYYYRILGVNPDATPEEIKAAYEHRINKISTADYGDDPEYVKKKKREITMAYRIITGSAPAPTKGQKRMRFEKLKDAMEMGEGGEDSWKDEADSDEGRKTAKFRFSKDTFASVGEKFSPLKSTAKNFSGSTGSGLSRNAVRGVIAALIIVAGFLIVALCLFRDFQETVDSEYYSTYGGIESYVDAESFERAESLCASLDFEEMLDTDAMDENRDYVDLTYGVDEYMSSAVYDNTYDLFYSLEIFTPYEFYSTITGNEKYYYSYDDYSCAQTLTRWMGAPDFEDIAGSENLYTGESILDMADYLYYLREVVEDNAEDY